MLTKSPMNASLLSCSSVFGFLDVAVTACCRYLHFVVTGITVWHGLSWRINFIINREAKRKLRMVSAEYQLLFVTMLWCLSKPIWISNEKCLSLSTQKQCLDKTREDARGCCNGTQKEANTVFYEIFPPELSQQLRWPLTVTQCHRDSV